jgi:hypothetical protein
MQAIGRRIHSSTAKPDEAQTIHPSSRRNAMKRTTIVIAAIAALGSTVARADNGFPFDEPYWKQQLGVHQANIAVQPAADASGKAKGPYDLVDNYNP